MTYRAIIFDLDGTLLNTLEDIGDATNHVLSERGFPIHDMDAYRSFIGDGAGVLIKRALPPGAQDKETIRSCLDAFLNQLFTGRYIQIVPGTDWLISPVNGLVGILLFAGLGIGLRRLRKRQETLPARRPSWRLSRETL